MSAPLTAIWLVTSGPGVTTAPTMNARTVAQRPNFEQLPGRHDVREHQERDEERQLEHRAEREEEARREVEEELERHDLRELDARRARARAATGSS